MFRKSAAATLALVGAATLCSASVGHAATYAPDDCEYTKRVQDVTVPDGGKVGVPIESECLADSYKAFVKVTATEIDPESARDIRVALVAPDGTRYRMYTMVQDNTVYAVTTRLGNQDWLFGVWTVEVSDRYARGDAKDVMGIRRVFLNLDA